MSKRVHVTEMSTWLPIYLMHTDRTCFRSVMPSMTFSMPSILSVRIPVSTAAENSSPTRARSWISRFKRSSATNSSCSPSRPL